MMMTSAKQMQMVESKQMQVSESKQMQMMESKQMQMSENKQIQIRVRASSKQPSMPTGMRHCGCRLSSAAAAATAEDIMHWPSW